MDLNTNMMRLGPIKFQHSGIDFNSLSRKDNYRWGTLNLLNQTPAKQAMGIGDKTITLSGIVFPHYDPTPNLGINTYIGKNQIHRLRQYAELQRPFVLSDGSGRIYGRWVITDITEEQTNFLIDGTPQKQTYTMSLASYDNSTDYNLITDDKNKVIRQVR